MYVYGSATTSGNGKVWIIAILFACWRAEEASFLSSAINMYNRFTFVNDFTKPLSNQARKRLRALHL